jgi:hypothetical protein
MTSNWSDKIEKLARALLWIVLAGVLISVPITIVIIPLKLYEKFRVEKSKVQEISKENIGPQAFMLKELDTYRYGLDYVNAEVGLSFTNTSPKKGYLCVTGEASNNTDKKSTKSLPACIDVGPYETKYLKLPLRKWELSAICPTEQVCTSSITEAQKKL